LRHPDLGHGGAGHPGHQRRRHRAHSRRRSDGWRQERRLCAAPVAARSARPVRGVAEGQLSRPRRSCDEIDPRHARRQGLRLDLGRTHEGRRALRLDDRAAGRDRMREAWSEHAEGGADPRAFPLAQAARRAAQPVRMTTPAPKLTVVTLGVRDVAASARFYETLGFVRKFRATGDEIVFFAAGGAVLALWDWDKLAEDAVVTAQPRSPSFRGSTLAWNCTTPAEVNAAFDNAIAAGAG